MLEPLTSTRNHRWNSAAAIDGVVELRIEAELVDLVVAGQAAIGEVQRGGDALLPVGARLRLVRIWFGYGAWLRRTSTAVAAVDGDDAGVRHVRLSRRRNHALHSGFERGHPIARDRPAYLMRRSEVLERAGRAPGRRPAKGLTQPTGVDGWPKVNNCSCSTDRLITPA